MIWNFSRCIVCAVVVLTGSSTVLADEVVLFRQGETPDPQDIARMLKGGKTSDRQGGPVAQQRGLVVPGAPPQRGLKLLSDQTPGLQAGRTRTSEGMAVSSPESGSAPAENSGTSFALQIQFPFNSAQIQPEMTAALNAVAQGVVMAGNMKIVVEGHTDSAGTADYNLALSRRRAEAVRSYLVMQGVPAANLKAVGRGKSDPLFKDNPAAPENRRVQFRSLG